MNISTKFEILVSSTINDHQQEVILIEPTGIIFNDQRAQKLIDVIYQMIEESPNIILSLGRIGDITKTAANQVAAAQKKAQRMGGDIRLVHVFDPGDSLNKRKKLTELRVTAPGEVFITLGLVNWLTNDGPLHYILSLKQAINSFEANGTNKENNTADSNLS